MIKAGLATVYEAKTGAEFGKLEAKYRKAEQWAKRKRKGMWGERKPTMKAQGTSRPEWASLSCKTYHVRMIERP